MVEYNNIQRALGDNQMFKGVSYTVQIGSVTVILGPSELGKTTLLRYNNFLERADGGRPQGRPPPDPDPAVQNGYGLSAL